MGAVTAAILTPFALVVFAVGQLRHVSTTAFVLYKAALGMLLGLVVTPVIAILALADGAPVANYEVAP